MRLLDTSTFQLREFPSPPHEYSILSHTWEEEEVTFDNLTSGKYQHLKGYQKVSNACRTARHEGFQYIWIDTCCINKSSSTELSEAINSMFAWYAMASVCYAYLGDVVDGSDLERSRWFLRGWTLQELVAPEVVVFLRSGWVEIGTKLNLEARIADITGIPGSVLCNRENTRTVDSIRACSVAQRMSWAAERKTTRREDLAYCLMGIFDVNMPLLYGEGEKAFLRLQQHISDQSHDASLFAWEYPHSPMTWEAGDQLRGNTTERRPSYTSGVLAENPGAFRRFRDARNMPFPVPKPHESGAPRPGQADRQHELIPGTGGASSFDISKNGAQMPAVLHWLRSDEDKKLEAVFCPLPLVDKGYFGDLTESIWNGKPLAAEQRYSATGHIPALHHAVSMTRCKVRFRGKITPGGGIGIAFLPCGTPLGRIGIFVHRHGDGVLERLHLRDLSVVFLTGSSDLAVQPPSRLRFRAFQHLQAWRERTDNPAAHTHPDARFSGEHRNRNIRLQIRAPRGIDGYVFVSPNNPRFAARFTGGYPYDKSGSPVGKLVRKLEFRSKLPVGDNADRWPPVYVVCGYSHPRDEVFVQLVVSSQTEEQPDQAPAPPSRDLPSESQREVQVRRVDSQELLWAELDTLANTGAETPVRRSLWEVQRGSRTTSEIREHLSANADMVVKVRDSPVTGNCELVIGVKSLRMGSTS